MKESSTNQTPELNFALTVRPTFAMLALSGFVDTLRHAAADNNKNRQIFCGWKIVGPTLDPVPSSAGIEVQPDFVFEDLVPPFPQYLVVIGGNVMSEIDDVPSTMLSFIQDFYADGGTVIGLCTGSFIVAQAGLTQGKRVVVHHRHRRDFLERYSEVDITSRQVFVEDGRVITCPGGVASIDLAIDLLSRNLGRTRAQKGLTEMSVDRHRSSFQMPRTPSDDLKCCGEWRVEKAAKLMQIRISKPTTIKQIADELGISVPQLVRLFKRYSNQTPLNYWINLRLDHALWLLLNSKMSLAQIALECGFSDAAHFSRQFKKRFTNPPKCYRDKVIPNEQSDYCSSDLR